MAGEGREIHEPVRKGGDEMSEQGEHVCKLPTVQDPRECVHCTKCGKFIYYRTPIAGTVVVLTLCDECSKQNKQELKACPIEAAILAGIWPEQRD
ncbi:unnamed protein product, partial [marine sediment metagenome]